VSPPRLALIGAGDRGADVYADYLRRYPDEGVLVALAEPDKARQSRVAERHALPATGHHDDWRSLLANADIGIDGVIVATPDGEHVAPAAAALEQGVDVLIEKPIADNADELNQLRQAADASDATVTVAHVLRHTPFFARLHELVAQQAIGELVHLDHTEAIGHWHFAHSYVRGNWRRAADSSPMLLAKACHDLDILRWLAGSACTSVASTGALRHFRVDNAPEGAPQRCLDGCPAASTCPFHAGRFYLEQLRDWTGWPVTTLVADPTDLRAREDALRQGPYGRCVYRADNDVADHQQVLLGFSNGVSATLTVTAFTPRNARTVAVRGTRGEILGDLEHGTLTVRTVPAAWHDAPADDAETARRRTAPVPLHDEHSERVSLAPHPHDHPIAPIVNMVGHAGGDDAIMRDFARRLRGRLAGAPREEARTSLAESLDSHLMAFAAEEARRAGDVRRPASTHRGDPNQEP